MSAFLDRPLPPRGPLRVLVESLSSEVVTVDELTNLGPEGLFLETSQILPAGSQVLLTFSLGEAEHIISAVGEVVWRSPDRADLEGGMGVRFVEIDPEDRDLIGRHVAGRAAGLEGTA